MTGIDPRPIGSADVLPMTNAVVDRRVDFGVERREVEVQPTEVEAILRARDALRALVVELAHVDRRIDELRASTLRREMELLAYKQARHLALVADGRVHLLADQPWTQALVDELLLFPLGGSAAGVDDQIDALSVLARDLARTVGATPDVPKVELEWRTVRVPSAEAAIGYFVTEVRVPVTVEDTDGWLAGHPEAFDAPEVKEVERAEVKPVLERVGGATRFTVPLDELWRGREGELGRRRHF